VKQTTRDPLWCPPSAMIYCVDIAPATEGMAVKPFTKGLVVDYGICKFKQRVLADCINKYEAEK